MKREKVFTRIVAARIKPESFDALERLRRETGAHTVSEVVRSIIEQTIVKLKKEGDHADTAAD